MSFDQEKFDKLINEGESLIREDPRKAIKSFEKANKMTESAYIHFSIGVCYQNRGKDKDAIKSFESSLQFASRNNENSSSCEFGLSAADALTAAYLQRNDHKKVVNSANSATTLIQHMLDKGWEDLYQQIHISIRKQAEYLGASYYKKKKWQDAYTWYNTAKEYGAITSEVHIRITELEGKLTKSGVNMMSVAKLGIDVLGLLGG